MLTDQHIGMNFPPKKEHAFEQKSTTPDTHTHTHTYTWATTCNNYLLFYSLGDCHRLVINNHRDELETLPFFIELDRLRKGHSRKIRKND